MKPTNNALRSLLEELAARLEGASIRRSSIEDVLASRPGGASLRRQIDGALVGAQIRVIEDVLVEPPPPVVNAVDESTSDVDPLDLARQRLLQDRMRLPHRLAKVILKAEEEVGLTLLARPGGEPLASGGFSTLSGEAREAAEALLLHNMGLIHSVAQRMGGQGLEYDDLVAHGVPGLVRAIELFDPYRGLKFSTYAMHWVRQSISRAIANEGRIIRLPVHIVDSIRQVKAAQERLTVDGKLPRWSDIARECHMSVEKVEELLRLAPAVVSLDSPVGNDGITLGDLLDHPVHEPELIEVHGLNADDLRALLSLLDEREADVLCRRNGLQPYDERQTLEDVGVVYGVTRERIRQIERNAITNLRILLGLQDPRERKQRKKRGAEQALAATA